MFENITKFFKKFGKNEKEDSKTTAKERLHLVLAQDRANISADFLEMMKQEIVDVVKKCFIAQQIDKKDKMFTIFDYSLSVVVAMEKRLDQLRKNELRNNVGGVMVSQGIANPSID